jgi:Ni,Fe-hydrogenase maturation factor
LSICRFPAQLMQLIEGFDRAIVIDAVEQTAGKVFEYSQADLLFNEHLHSTHGIGVGEALALAERLLPAPVEVTVLGVGVGERDDAETVDIAGLLPMLQNRLTAVLRTADGLSG